MSHAYNSRKKAIKKGLVPKGKKSVRDRMSELMLAFRKLDEKEARQ